MNPKNSLLLALAAVGSVQAQRPSGTPICDYYTTALLKNNTAENQYTLLTLLVNTVVIGNYTQPNTGVAVPGILAPGTVNGTAVNLLPYFNGALASSNRGGSSGVSVNFLDDGGAVPLMMNKPANGTTSNQYFLLTHLYQFFGALLGCSQYGMGAFPAYMGHASMYSVHKFMDLDNAEVTYFITQVALAGASFGVATSDLQAVGAALSGLFGVKCGPPTTAIPAQGAQLQSICIADDCPLSVNATCAAYAPAVPPMSASMSSSMAGGCPAPTTSMMASSGAMSATASASKTTTTAPPATVSASLAAAGPGGFGLAAFVATALMVVLAL